ncbi:uncharacterized protein O3C94_010976 [Discoglossus pictus]
MMHLLTIFIFLSTITFPIIISKTCDMNIHQVPKTIETTIRHSANIHCTIPGENVREISLYRGDKRLITMEHNRTANIIENLKHRIRVYAPLFPLVQNISVTLQELDQNDSGFYVCKAKVRRTLKEICGKGTELTVSLNPRCISGERRNVLFHSVASISSRTIITIYRLFLINGLSIFICTA